MAQDIQFDVLNRVRDQGFTDEATLYLSRRDAQRMVDGFQEIRSDIVDAEHISRHPGTDDGQGLLRYQMDERLERGVGAIEQPNSHRVPIKLSDIIR